MKRLLLVMILCSPLLLTAQSYKIYDTTRQKEITTDEVVALMDKADVLFYGEEHNDSVGHKLELELFSKLVQRYPAKAILSLEMFETDTQPVLNEYLAGLIREKNLVNDARAWNNYKDYRPMVELAKEKHIPVIAANAPGRYTNRVTRLGLAGLQQLDATAKGWLAPLPIDTATGAYYQKFVQIMGGHGAMGGMQIYQSQNLWDATMAYSIAKYLKAHAGSKIMQVNGSFHSEDKLGAAAQLKKYAPAARMINIATYAVSDLKQVGWSKYSKDNDIIILTDAQLPRSF
ncbi:ChaN family lipoprotein [Mucilaginibacter daejeonensis]|uniref:ChaN family lipoprotein n=1 Tax=Mucilaginibacter daejeonensis TaxID=398049 RepID=UPI001D1728C5|nr:ChaN family lipoprotein [Mucilaginibacter daejeonensis]UEG55253.1 ChaN family lipoprotein [Mucilaginibacter daejeonensis]